MKPRIIDAIAWLGAIAITLVMIALLALLPDWTGTIITIFGFFVLANIVYGWMTGRYQRKQDLRDADVYASAYADGYRDGCGDLARNVQEKLPEALRKLREEMDSE